MSINRNQQPNLAFLTGKKVRTLSILFFSFIITACTDSGRQNNNLYRFPLLNNCEQQVNERLSNLGSKSYEFNIFKFSHVPDYASFIIGYVEFEDKYDNRKSIFGDWNMAIHGCEPNTYFKIDKSDRFAEEVSSAIQSASHIQSGNLFFNDSKEAIEIHFYSE